MIEKYGADALRLWELYMSPFDEATNWNESGIAGPLRFIQARLDDDAPLRRVGLPGRIS